MDEEQRRRDREHVFERVVVALQRLQGWKVLERDDTTLEAILYRSVRGPVQHVGDTSRMRRRVRTWRKVWVDEDGRYQNQDSDTRITLGDSTT